MELLKLAFEVRKRCLSVSKLNFSFWRLLCLKVSLEALNVITEHDNYHSYSLLLILLTYSIKKVK